MKEKKDCFANVSGLKDGGCYALTCTYNIVTRKECKWCEVGECSFYKPKSEISIEDIKSELRKDDD